MLGERNLERRSAVAKNSGSGRRFGAVTDRFQLANPKSDIWSVFKASTGEFLRTKKSVGPAKGIRVGTPKNPGGRS